MKLENSPRHRTTLSHCLVAAFAVGLCSILLLSGCGSRENSPDQMWSAFADDAIALARKGDVNALVQKLTVYKDEDLDRLKQMVASAGQEVSAEGDEGTEQERRQQAIGDAQLFVDSYSDLFDGKPCRFSTRETQGIPGLNLYSLIIWVEKGGKFHGIKVDNLCRIGDRMKVLDWVALSGYEMDTFAHGAIRKKKAILLAEEPSECRFPRDGIMYETEYVGAARRSSAW